MLTRLRLRNFQGWEEVDLPLSQITAIVGETDMGKSALLRAITALAYHSGDVKTYLREGADSFFIELTTSEGHVVSYERGTGINRYTVDDVVYDKVGREVPSQVIETLGIRPVSVGDDDFLLVQYQAQQDGPFLLADGGARATRLLGGVADVARLHEVAKVANREARSLSTKANQHAETVERLKEDLARYEPLDAVKDLVEEYPELVSLLYQTQQHYEHTNKAYSNWMVANQRLGATEWVKLAAKRVRGLREEIATAVASQHGLLVEVNMFNMVTGNLKLHETSLSTVVFKKARSRALVVALTELQALTNTEAEIEKYMSLVSQVKAASKAVTTLRNKRDGLSFEVSDLSAKLTCPACGVLRD